VGLATLGIIVGLPQHAVTDVPRLLLGDGQIEKHAAAEPALEPQAFPYTALASGAAMSVMLYLGSGSRAAAVEVAIYTAKDGNPGSLLTSGADRRPTAGAWNLIDVRSVAIRRGRTYWLALLGIGGKIVYRGSLNRGCSSERSAKAGMRSLPRDWQPGRRLRTCPASAVVLAPPVPSVSAQASGGLPAPGGSTASTTTSSGGSAPYGSGGGGSNGGGGQPVPVEALPSTAPTYTVPPVVSGAAQQSDTLSATTGSWTGSPTGYAYQWQDCTGANACANIASATDADYTVAAGDNGDTVRVIVTASNAIGSTSADSAQTATVTSGGTGSGGGSGLADVVAPYFAAASGQAVVGQVLAVSTGSWSGAPLSFSYQWMDCTTSGGQPPMTGGCSTIGGATSSTYTVAASDVGHSLGVVVTAANASGSSSTSLSGACGMGENNSQGESYTAPPPAEPAGCSPISAVVGTSPSGEKFCSNSFVTCGYPDPLTGDVGVPPGTSLTTVSGSCGCVPSGASWSDGNEALVISGNNVTLKDLYVPGNIEIVGKNDTVTDSVVTTGICGTSCSNPEPIEATSTAQDTEITYDTVYGGENGTVHNASNEPLLINHVYSYGSCTGQLGWGDVWNSYFITDIEIDDQDGEGLCHVEDGYLAGGFESWPSNPWGGTCPGACSSSNDSYTNYQDDVMLNPQGQTAAIFLDNHAFGETGDNNVTINGTFVAGGGYAIYGDNNGDTSSNITITNNRWSNMYYQHGGYYGACVWNDAATTLTGDSWDDTLEPVLTACGGS
jgi:hypothetical protein